MTRSRAPLTSETPRPSSARPAEPQLVIDADAPYVGPIGVAFPEHEYDQRTLLRNLERRWRGRHKNVALLQRLHQSVQVARRRLALPLEEYDRLDGFGSANDAFIRVGTELGARAVERAVAGAGHRVEDIDAIFFTTVTGVAVPTIDARLVNRLGMNVVVVEPRQGLIDKACGEAITPGGMETLAELGVRPEGMPIVGVRYCDAIEPTLRAEGRFPRGAARGIRRTTLYSVLQDRALSVGVRLRVGRVEAFEQRLSEVRVDGFRGRWLIGADGLHSQVRRILGVERGPRFSPRFGVRRHWSMQPWTDHVEVHLAPGAEAYVTPVAEDLVGVAFLFEPPARFEELLGRFPLLARRVEGHAPASTLRGAGPFEQRVRRHVVGDVLLVGDAAGYLDPLTGEGLALGIASASAAIESLVEGRPEAYERRYRRLTRRYFALTSVLLSTVRRPLLHRRFIRAASLCPSAFDASLGVLGHLATEDG